MVVAFRLHMPVGGGEASDNSCTSLFFILIFLEYRFFFLLLLLLLLERSRTHSAQKKKKMERKGKKKVAEKSERWSTKIKNLFPPASQIKHINNGHVFTKQKGSSMCSKEFIRVGFWSV
jgi:hypothetical protein